MKSSGVKKCIFAIYLNLLMTYMKLNIKTVKKLLFDYEVLWNMSFSLSKGLPNPIFRRGKICTALQIY